MAKKVNLNKVTLNEFLNKYYLLIAVLLVLIILGIAGALIIYPQYTNLMTVRDEQLTTSEIDLKEKTTYLESLKQMQANYEDLNKENFRNFDKVMLTEEEIPWLFARIESVIEAANMTLLNISYVKEAKTLASQDQPPEDLGEEEIITEEPLLDATGLPITSSVKLPPGVGAINVNITVSSDNDNWESFKKIMTILEMNIELFEVKNITYSAGQADYSLSFDTYYLIENNAQN
ncbi:MAG: hypothetical protein ABH835_01195 [Patescibacteria group bacterium]